MPLIPEALQPYLHRLQNSIPIVLIRRIIEIDLLAQAASLSFFTLISLAPLLILLLWLTASLYPSAQEALLDQLGSLAGDSARVVANTIIEHAMQRPDIGSLAGLWSTLLLFVGATAVFARLQATLNLIFHSGGHRTVGVFTWLRKRAFSFGLVFALGILVLVSTTLSTTVEFIFADMPKLLPIAGNIVALATYSFAFALLYIYLPDRRVHWRQALLGGLITSGLFVLGRWTIGLYITRAAPGSAYGSMGTLVILLIWMYYAALVFYTGALITAVIDERLGDRATTAATASTDTDTTPPAPDETELPDDASPPGAPRA